MIMLAFTTFALMFSFGFEVFAFCTTFAFTFRFHALTLALAVTFFVITLAFALMLAFGFFTFTFLFGFTACGSAFLFLNAFRLAAFLACSVIFSIPGAGCGKNEYTAKNKYQQDLCYML